MQTFCAAFEGVVVIDEAYVDFASEDCMDLARTLPNVLVARTLSKSYSLAGIRLGYAVGPAPLIDALYKIKDSYNVDSLSQVIALAALDDVETMQENCERIITTRTRVSSALAKLGFEVYPSQSNFLWVKPATSSAGQVFNALKERKILVRHFAGGNTDAYLRITIGTEEDMDALLDVLKDIGPYVKG